MCLLVVEIYLRHQYSHEKQLLINKYKNLDASRGLCTVKSSNSDLIYELTPNKCGNNSHGYFDSEYDYRILVIGDSVAQGQGVKINQNFSNLLENKLNGETSKKKYEVITLAVTGYSTSQELVLLENEAEKYSPDFNYLELCFKRSCSSCIS